MTNLTKVFTVKLDNKPCQLFPSFNDVEKYISDTFDNNDNESLLEYMTENISKMKIIYDIDIKQPIYIFETDDSFEITNSFDTFHINVSKLGRWEKIRYYGCKYVDFNRIEDYPQNVDTCEVERQKLYKEATLKYELLIIDSYFSVERRIVDHHESVLNFCYNTMIEKLQDSKGPLCCLDQLYWKYINFFDDTRVGRQYSDIRFVDPESNGMNKLNDVKQAVLNCRQQKQILDILNVALELYMKGDRKAAYKTLFKINKLLGEMNLVFECIK